MKTSLVFFSSPEKAVYQELEQELIPAGSQVLVKLDYDLISAGTELANYKNMPNTVAASQGFPHYPGYTASGHVIQCGPDVKRFKTGDNVVVWAKGHRSHVLDDETNFFPVPEGITQQEAAFSYLATFSFLGVRKLKIQLGESVMIAGGGLLGLLALQIARASGACPVLLCDYSPVRREMALKMGADFVLDPGEKDFIKKVRDLTGNGPNAVVEVTGHIEALKQALEYVARMGRISLLGCTRVSDQTIDFYKYLHLRGVELIGCHTSTRPGVDSQPGQWTMLDDFKTFFRLIRARGLNVRDMIGEVVHPAEAQEIYQTLSNSKEPPLGVLLDWTQTGNC